MTMAGDTVVTIVGNLVADPELRFTSSGAPVANLTVASTPRQFDKQTNEWKDNETLFLRGSVWRQQAENVAETLQKGMRVIVTGRLKPNSWETKEGEKRTSIDLDIEEIGPSLRSATAQVTRAQRQEGDGGSQERGGSYGGQGGSQERQAAPGADPWATPPAGAGQARGWGEQPDAPPF